jgi:hypothetical protein
VQALVTHGGVPLKRTLSVWSLVSLGIGCIIGAGIFVLTGHPAIALSFVFGGIASIRGFGIEISCLTWGVQLISLRIFAEQFGHQLSDASV